MMEGFLLKPILLTQRPVDRITLWAPATVSVLGSRGVWDGGAEGAPAREASRRYLCRFEALG